MVQKFGKDHGISKQVVLTSADKEYGLMEFKELMKSLIIKLKKLKLYSLQHLIKMLLMVIYVIIF
jgi:hypothetical protein